MLKLQDLLSCESIRGTNRVSERAMDWYQLVRENFHQGSV